MYKGGPKQFQDVEADFCRLRAIGGQAVVDDNVRGVMVSVVYGI